MAVLLPENGKADWTDYEDYWREADAEWLQARSILRVTDNAERNGLAQAPGGVVYNDSIDSLELRSKYGGYKTLVPLSTNLTTVENAGPPISTVITHKDAGAGKGVAFSGAVTGVTTLGLTADRVVLAGGALTAEATGVSIKTGTKTAKLTTDTANLVSDSPVSAPGVVITAPGALSASGRAGTIGSLAVEGVLTAASVSAGTGAINGGSATIGGVTIASNKVTASAGFDVQGGSFYGDATSAFIRHSGRTGPFVQTFATYINVGGGGMFDIYNQMRIIGAAAYIQHYQTGKNFAPSFYAASDPGVANYPEGTIWIS